MTRLTLRAGLRSMPLTAPILNGDVECQGITIEPKGATPYTDTFRLMARELAYDIAEMPVATQMLAVDAGVPLTAMPIVLAGGGLPHTSLLCLAHSDIAGPQDLRGRRLGIRAYAQTTAVWIRGLLQHEYDVSADAMTWVTTEDSHVASFVDPAHVQRVAQEDLVTMLRRGKVDAIVASPHVVKDATDLRHVISDARTVGGAWAEREGVYCVNHVLSLQSVLIERHPEVVEALARGFVDARAYAETQPENARGFAPFGDSTANRRSVDLMLRYAYEQKLTTRRYRYDDLFLAWPNVALADAG